jgi:CubicO group peptidase (beta-lactamase class C family)
VNYPCVFHICNRLTRIPGYAAMLALLWVIPSRLAAEAKSPDYTRAIGKLEQIVHEEMTTWGISGISLALVDDQQTIYAAGFGEAKRDSVFRCGSISKLFNAVAVMQLVEAGKLDLDAPLDRYGPGLLPVIPFTNETAVVLRQLLCHRSGMVRETPVGGYFDDAQAGLARMVASVTQCVLVNPPNTKTRYSNVGPSIAGRVVELVSGQKYPDYQRQHVLGPLGMTSSAWQLKGVPRGRLAPYYMLVADGRSGFKHQRAPVFDLGTIPAGNLFTTAEDLARFVSMLAAEGRGGKGRVLTPESLGRMFTPQLTTEPTGFGLGFMVGKFRDHKTISHNGAVYGCSSSLVFLPGAKIGVVVLGNEDEVNGRIGKLANFALSLMLEVKLGETPPSLPEPFSLSADALAAFAGDYESQSYWAKLEAKGGRLSANISGQPTKLTPVGPLRFLADSRVNDAASVMFERDAAGCVTGFTLGIQKFVRVPLNVPDVPAEWHAYFGSYGPSFIPLVVSARHGHLYAMTENMADYRLTPVNRHVFAFPPGLYVDEHLVFLPDRGGKPHSVNLANMVLRRR